MAAAATSEGGHCEGAAATKSWQYREEGRASCSSAPSRNAKKNSTKPRRAPPRHSLRCFAPYVVYDVCDGRAVDTNSSWANETEANLALLIIREMLSDYPTRLTPRSIGVVTPYNGQVRHIRRLLVDSLGLEVGSQLEVSTVDGFQGREKEIMLLSCVRSDQGRSTPRGIGFLKDDRRVNVMLTRAKYAIFVLLLGHGPTLRRDPLWGGLFDDAEARRCVIRAPSPIGPWFEAACKMPALPPAEEAEEAAAEEAAADGGAEEGGGAGGDGGEDGGDVEDAASAATSTTAGGKAAAGK